VKHAPSRRNARDLIDLVLDPQSFQSWDRPIDISIHPSAYQEVLRRTGRAAGTDESVLTGRGTASGRPVALVVNEFRFLAGSIGRASAERITAAIRRATAEKLPLLASTASGGTRMQEGTLAFLTMIDITRAIMDHRAAGLPYLVHLGHPTTGGVYASWGSLGHLTVAEPGALIGFLGPKVYEGLKGKPFPPGVQTAENLASKGVIDAVVATEDLAGLLDRALGVLLDPPTRVEPVERTPSVHVTTDAWAAVQTTRRLDRIGVRDLLRLVAHETVRLRGTDDGERDDTVLVALTRLDGQPCVLVGQDRTRQSADRAMGPAALREARRAMHLAEELNLPLVTIIDTPGAELSPAAEERAMAGEISRCIATLCTMTVPTVSVLLGQGAGGGALALLPAQRTIALQNAWLAPLAPEGASIIVCGDTAHAAEMASAQRVGAVDLQAAGAVDHIVSEQGRMTRLHLLDALVAEIGEALRCQSADLVSRTSAGRVGA